MDFHSEDNFLWDQNIISHNLSYNINDELTREMRRMEQDGPHSGAAQRKRDHFTGSRKALACYIKSETELNEKSHGGVLKSKPDDLDDSENETLNRHLDKKSSGLCGIVNNTVTSINKDMTDLFGTNWQFIFLVILIAICIIQYLHYRHATAQLVDLVKLLMVQNYESELLEIPQHVQQDMRELQNQQVKPQQTNQTNNTGPSAEPTSTKLTAVQNTKITPAPAFNAETQALVDKITSSNT